MLIERLCSLLYIGVATSMSSRFCSFYICSFYFEWITLCFLWAFYFEWITLSFLCAYLSVLFYSYDKIEYTNIRLWFSLTFIKEKKYSPKDTARDNVIWNYYRGKRWCNMQLLRRYSTVLVFVLFCYLFFFIGGCK